MKQKKLKNREIEKKNRDKSSRPELCVVLTQGLLFGL